MRLVEMQMNYFCFHCFEIRRKNTSFKRICQLFYVIILIIFNARRKGEETLPYGDLR